MALTVKCNSWASRRMKRSLGLCWKEKPALTKAVFLFSLLSTDALNIFRGKMHVKPNLG